ncbi:MAG: hypothetical protein IKA04_10985 [Alistipes sp.]|nr:hypothetical protein [Alistipes sp.]
MGIIDRIKQFADFKQISIRKFCELAGVASGGFIKVKSVGSESLLKIFTAFPEINLEWLITGQGSMLKSATPVADNKFAMELIEKKDETIKKLERTIWEQEKQIEELKKISAISTSTLPGTTYTSPQQRK